MRMKFTALATNVLLCLLSNANSADYSIAISAGSARLQACCKHVLSLLWRLKNYSEILCCLKILSTAWTLVYLMVTGKDKIYVKSSWTTTDV